MKMYRPLSGRHLLPALPILLLGALCCRVQAQGPMPGAPESSYNKTFPKTYTNKTSFRLPIQIDEKSRPAVLNVILYARENGGDWKRIQTVAGNTDHFSYHATQDGEYWFSVVTVDKNGKAAPPDIRKEPPALIVVVDTQAPTVKIDPVNLPGGAMALHCKVIDQCPDYEKLQMAYKDANSPTWVPLQKMPGSTDTFQLPNVPVLNGSIRYTAQDRAGNMTTQVVQLREQQPASEVKQTTQETPAGTTPGLPPAPQTVQSAQPVPVLSETIPPLGKVPPVTQAAKNDSVLPAPPKQSPLPPVAPSTSNSGSTSGSALPVVKENTNSLPVPQLPPITQVPATPQHIAPVQASNSGAVPSSPASGLPIRQVLNTTRASIDYKIDKAGPSGVGRVDVWIKTEQPGTWQRLCSDDDRRSPAEITLPGEGMFGIQVVVTNGNGFGGKAPGPNDPPSLWIEVDTTPPIAQLHTIDPVINGGNIDIRWTASDKNMGQAPVSLFYATRKEGPWLPIARRIKNSGQHSWQFPHDAGPQFFVRLEVTDEAGNMTRTESPTPVVLDLTEPRAQVVGVTAVGGTATPPSGN